MTIITRRRGMIRPISDLPPLAVAPSLIEVEGVDGRHYKTAPASGLIFPDDAATFGTPTADDEEWDGAASITERGWTIETALGGGNLSAIDNTFAPSRLRVSNITNVTDTLSLTRPLTVDKTGDISLTFDTCGVWDLNFKVIEAGFRESNVAAGTQGIVGIMGFNATPVVVRRKYSNVGTNTFVDQSLANASNHFRAFFHLQRVAGTWSMWTSVDCATWIKQGAGLVDAFSINYLWIRMSGNGAAAATRPYDLSNDWLRLNRFFR